MNRVVAVANQKGGVGKTTTAVNIAASLAAVGRRVLLIDLDPQGHASMGCGVDKSAVELGSCEVLLGECTARQAIVAVADAGFDILPTNPDLTAAEVRLLAAEQGRELRLREALQPVRGDYDLIFIDCPPSLNMLTVNALVAADTVLIPMQCEYYALEGLSDLVNTIKIVHAKMNPDLQVIGLLRVMFDPRMMLSQQVSTQLEKHFGDKVFKTIIPRNVRLAEAQSYGVPGVIFDAAAKGAQAYVAFGKELVERLQK